MWLRVDCGLRPLESGGQLIDSVPGALTAQHTGGGKAEQYFLRGFDADHGTDLAVYFDGVPVNLRSHTHGQGYLDLHFITPETIARLDVAKGPYWTRFGDFATAAPGDLPLAFPGDFGEDAQRVEDEPRLGCPPSAAGHLFWVVDGLHFQIFGLIIILSYDAQ